MKEIEEDINSGKVFYVCGSKNQYCQNDFTIQVNLQIQCNSYLITNAIFHITRTTRKKKKNLKFLWRHKKPWTSKAIWKRKTELEGSGSLTSDYTAKLQSSKQHGTHIEI